jgi:hypothetical protein
MCRLDGTNDVEHRHRQLARRLELGIETCELLLAGSSPLRSRKAVSSKLECSARSWIE